jgi:ABC-type phosphate transport system substrate-binding protein
MKQKLLCAAVGAAFAGIAGQAAALPPSDFNSTAGDTGEAWISGATAQDETLKAAMARLCTPGTLDLYFHSSNQLAFFCAVSPAIGGKNKIVVYKSGVGGSASGTTPLVAPGTQLGFMSMGQIKSAAICTTVTSVVASVTVSGDPLGVPSYGFRSCGGATTNNLKLPSGGISDLEPNKFLDGPTPPATSPNQLVFGIAVTENLYRALQVMQGKDSATTTADPGNDPAITGITTIPVRDNEANMPSLARDTIQSLFNGTLTTWSDLRGVGSTLLPASGSGDMSVYVARRVPGSGTQKSTEIFLMGGINPTDGSHSVKCNPTAVQMVASGNTSESICTTPGLVKTFEGSGTGNVRNCLAAHNTAGRYAIGLLSTETGYAAQVGKFRFVKIDGYAPSLINVALNRYKHWVEGSLNTPTYAVAAGEAAIRDALFGGMGSPTVTKAFNMVMPQVWGRGALLSSPMLHPVTNPAAATAPGLSMDDMLANPVNYYTKAAAGSPDNCLPGVTAFTPPQQ